MLADIVDLLACPVCGDALRVEGRTVQCDRGHSADIARQGYVTLLGPRGRSSAGDTSAMVDAREAVHGAGVLDSVARAVARRARDVAPTGARVLDIGAGTGAYLAAVLDAVDGARGVAIDISVTAAKRAARCHPRAGSVVGDAWRGLPVRDGVVDLALVVFGPRPADELTRVLTDDGALLVVVPETGHLAGLVDALPADLGLLRVDPAKDDRLAASLGGTMGRVDEVAVRKAVPVSHAIAEALILMGPHAFHVDAQRLRIEIRQLPEPVEVSVDVTLSTWVRF